MDAVEVKQSLREVLSQVEIPEKWTQEPPCFATTGVRLRSHRTTIISQVFLVLQFRTNLNFNQIVTTFIDLIEVVQLTLFIDKTVNSWHSNDHEYIHIYIQHFCTFIYTHITGAYSSSDLYRSLWRHQMETFSALLAFVRGIQQSKVNFSHKGQRRRALMFSLICAWANVWASNRDAGDLRHNRAHDVTVMSTKG